MGNVTLYNPKTDHIKRSSSTITFLNCKNDDYESVGCRKVAEAFTSVNEKERIELWKVYKRGIIDLSKLSSKLRHKLKRLGMWDIGEPYSFYMPKGEKLLNSIKKKRNKSRRNG